MIFFPLRLYVDVKRIHAVLDGQFQAGGLELTVLRGRLEYSLGFGVVRATPVGRDSNCGQTHTWHFPDGSPAVFLCIGLVAHGIDELPKLSSREPFTGLRNILRILVIRNHQ